MADIKIEQLTNQSKNGVLDNLLSAISDNLKGEFSGGRITATEYAKIYASSIDSAISQSIQFILQKDISARQAELLSQQKLAVEADIALTEANTSKVLRDITLMDKQEELMDKQIELAALEVIKVDRQNALLLLEQDKLEAEVTLVQAQVTQANKQIEILTLQALNLPKEGALLDKQILKSQEEANLLSQRIKTEVAQVFNVVPTSGGDVPVAGVLGRQNLLYEAQTAQFKFDPKYKLLSQMIQVWTTLANSDDGASADTQNHLSALDIGKVVAACMADVNITPHGVI